MAPDVRRLEERPTIGNVHTRLVLVEYKVGRIYWAVNGILGILATAVLGFAVSWALNGGFTILPGHAKASSPPPGLHETE